jgi:hypothetical protein
LGPIPNPQSPIPNPQSPIPIIIILYDKKYIKKININIFNKLKNNYINFIILKID